MLTYSKACSSDESNVACRILPRLTWEIVVNDPRRLEAQRDHREVAIADTYTLMTRATIPFSVAR